MPNGPKYDIKRVGTLIVNEGGRDRCATSADHDVFIVHGHDHLALNAVHDFMTELGLTPVVLRNEPSRGRTIIEKIEHYANVKFAVVLMTADDQGASNRDITQHGTAAWKARARQNVIFEHGYFMARLGRQRVTALVGMGVEEPSDIAGIGYIRMGPGWKTELRRELAAAGLVAPGS